MSKYFFESSAFIKRYKSEDGSQFVNGIFDGSHDLFYLNLALIEVQKVFYRLWRYPLQQDIQQNVQITENEFRALMGRFAADLQELFMHRVEFTEEMVKCTYTILEKVWVPNIFDLVQLSAYLITYQEYQDIIFVCSDLRSNLIEAAKSFVPEEQIIVP